MIELLKKTPLNKVHHELRARMADFAGWQLPIWYTTILEEHRAVRSGAGMFDVSDMGRVWITGRKAGAFLDRVLTRPASRLEIGSSQLCLLCLEDGGILDGYSVGQARTLISSFKIKLPIRLWRLSRARLFASCRI
jgi:glycine cleavage system aminomethyltransferase T